MNFLFAESGIDFKLRKDTTNHLIIENAYLIDKLVMALQSCMMKEDESVRFYEDEMIDFHKYVHVCFSPVELQLESRELQKSLFKKLVDVIESTDLSLKFLEVQSLFIEAIEFLKMESDFALEVYGDLKLESLFKTLNVNLKKTEGSFGHRLVEYILSYNRLLQKKIFVFVGCQAYLSAAELGALVEQMKYENIYLLFIDGFQRMDFNNLANHYIIDMDVCEIHESI